MKKGQGAFEYVLLLGGVLLIVVLAVVLLRGGIFQSGGQAVSKSSCQNGLALSTTCTNPPPWNSEGVVVPAPSACTQYEAAYPADVHPYGLDPCAVPIPGGLSFAKNDSGWCCGVQPG